MAHGNFNELIQSDKPTLVDFSAAWCGPCKMMVHILEEVKAAIGENAKVLKIDIDKNPRIAEAYQVRNVPTLMIFKHGKVVWKQSGVVTTAYLTSAIKQYS
jgi:thioredoxin 1